MEEGDMERIAYLGLGTMGSGMAANLIEAGYPVLVWNRTAEKCEPLVEMGARQMPTPAAATSAADVIMYCLSNDDAVESVLFSDDGVIAGTRGDQIAIDMSTVHPDTSRREATAYADRDVAFLDAPVFGSKGEAESGGLWILVGGNEDAFERIRPILEHLSASVHYMGGTGMGTSMKLVGNLIVAAQLEAVGEALILAQKAGLDLNDVMDVLDVVDFRSPLISGVGRSLIERDFTTFFALRHMLKDANLIARFAEDLRVPVPGSAVVREMLKAAVNQGWGEENASALVKALEAQAGTVVRE
jgi:3-hydroxyisobutyrate dehydrogenase-like beta-hydroxyacid dehydrogenase